MINRLVAVGVLAMFSVSSLGEELGLSQVLKMPDIQAVMSVNKTALFKGGGELNSSSLNNGLSPQSLSPTLILWSFVSPQYPNMESVNLPGASNGEPSVAILLRQGYQPAKITQNIWSGVVNIVSGRTVPPPPIMCGGNDIDFTNCCLNSPYPECVEKIDWSYCSGAGAPDICRNLNKGAAGLAVLMEIAKEIAASSQLATVAEVKSKLDGGQLYFVWPYVASSDAELKDKWTITKINGGLIDRILAVTNGAIGTLRRIKDMPVGVKSLECDINKSSFAQYIIGPESQPNIFFISLGQETKAVMPASQAPLWSPSLYVESQQGVARLALTTGVRTPLGADTEWSQFADIGQTNPDTPFFCLPSVKMYDFYRLKPQINNPDAGLFIFALGYLAYAFEEYSK